MKMSPAYAVAIAPLLLGACGAPPQLQPLAAIDVAAPRASDAGAISTPCVAAAATPATPVASASAAAATVDCDHVRDADFRDLGACELPTNVVPKDGDIPPEGLTVAVSPRPSRLKPGAHLSLIVSIVNTGASPARIALVPEEIYVQYLDGRRADTGTPRGKCVRTSNVLVIGSVTLTATVRVTLEPGGSVHRAFEWDAVAQRWGAPPKTGEMCPRLPDAPLAQGTYYALASVPALQNYAGDPTTASVSFEIER
jgi:hypothetical protein